MRHVLRGAIAALAQGDQENNGIVITMPDSVRIVLFNEAVHGEFVALTETDDPDNLKLPGGRFGSQDESPEEAAARELREELGLEPEQVGLTHAGNLPNDDGISKRYIFTGRVALAAMQPSEEIARTELLTETSVPEGKNRGHMLAAVALSAQAWENKE